MTLNTRDRAEGDQRGRQKYAAAVLGTPVGDEPTRRVVRLGELCDRFLQECPALRDNVQGSQDEARTRLAILRAVIGDSRDVATLTSNDVWQYTARRRSGGIDYGVDRHGRRTVTRAVRQRAVQADLKLLKQVLYWACTVAGAGGRPRLTINPLEHVEVKGESDVRRPVASQERFEATRAAMQQFQHRYSAEAANAARPKARRRAEARAASWVRAELALVLMEATGRRRGSIAALRWEDIDYERQRITWRAANDKKRKSATVIYPRSLFEELREFQRQLAAAGGCVFPRVAADDRPAPPELLSQRIAQAERAAGLPKLDGSLCHAYRRKWKSERSHHPVGAVAKAGGWTDITTMLKCYDIPDDEAILAVTSEPRRRREAPLNPLAPADIGEQEHARAM
jgi:integrase